MSEFLVGKLKELQHCDTQQNETQYNTKIDTRHKRLSIYPILDAVSFMQSVAIVMLSVVALG
jgi:hypothetical protein